MYGAKMEQCFVCIAYLANTFDKPHGIKCVT